MCRITQPSGPKAVAIVSLGEYVSTAQAIISSGEALPAAGYARPEKSSCSGVAVLTSGSSASGGFGGRNSGTGASTSVSRLLPGRVMLAVLMREPIRTV